MARVDSEIAVSAGPRTKQGGKFLLALTLLLVAGGFTIYKLDAWRALAQSLGPAPALSTGIPAMTTNGHPGVLPVVDLSDAIIPEDKIRRGGPPKDGIASVTNPALIPAGEAGYLKASDQVAGVVIQGEARAYPLKILTRHEAVNDRIGDVAFAVTYCPLCDSTAVFDLRTELGELNLGISGLLYNSNVLFYDRSKNESIWSQMLGKAVAGPGANQSLESLPVEVTTWEAWRTRHPETKVLAGNLGFGVDYDLNIYALYFASPWLMFPAEPRDDRFPLKSPVLGVWTANTAKAYPLAAFSGKDEPVTFEDEIEGVKLSLAYDPKAKSLRVVEASQELRWMYAFWFAWYAFHPETQVYDLPN